MVPTLGDAHLDGHHLSTMWGSRSKTHGAATNRNGLLLYKSPVKCTCKTKSLKRSEEIVYLLTPGNSLKKLLLEKSNFNL